MSAIVTGALFELGEVAATRPALAHLVKCGENVLDLLARHQRGDWGVVCDADASENEQAIHDGSRILSSYEVGCRGLWVITDAQDDDGRRVRTTILFPDEY